MTRFELIFVCIPAIGNLVPAVEFANLLTKHDPRFSATFLVITIPQRPLINTYVQSHASSSSPTNHLRFLHLPTVDLPTPDHYQSSVGYISLLIQKHKPHVKDAILSLIPDDSPHPDSVQLAGVFVDMFSTTIIDVAAELGVPSYLFFASPASFLGFMLHLPQLAAESLNLDHEFAVPSFNHSLPRSVLPNLVLKAKDGLSWLLYHAARYRETKGIVINSVQELDPHALDSLSASHIPCVYPIGPVLDLDGPARWDPNSAQYGRIMKWLDHQPPSSVVFLCFGSMGSLSENQVREIAIGLERANVRFLWALRQPPKAQLEDPTDYRDLENVLPDGFLERTAEMGLVCGWVAQAKIMVHKAIGGFVSHCGWNSILESLWCGVPIATWPIYAEQQMNAFFMVKELGLAVEITLDYRGGHDLVRADAVEAAIRRLMNGCDEVRGKVKEMREKFRMALMGNDGSSYKSLVSLVEKLTTN